MKVVKEFNVINQGGFGIIHRVSCDDGKHYARKTFHLNSLISSNPTISGKLKDRFIREVKTQKLLPEELFIPIVYEDLSSENPWFLMPLADNVYSNEIQNSKAEGRHPNGLADILNSLEFIHSKGLVHRDLKPQNVLLHNGIWKLADFGLISQDKDILSLSITTTNNAFGTEKYCAPEQITEFKRVSPQADIYSFGAILHDIFTDGNRVPYSELKAEGEIGMIIEKCTKTNKDLRFKSVSNLRDKLLYILSKKDSSTVSSSGASEWVVTLKDYLTWDIDTLEAFIFYLRRNTTEYDSIFFENNNEILAKFLSIDKDLYNEYCIIYLEWVNSKNFKFDYCDVIVGYLNNIYTNSNDLEVKARSVIVSAELGRSHNRWYVMNFVVKMSSPKINDNLAFRISLEIELNRKNKDNFNCCVEGIELTTDSYHQIIKDVL